MVQYESMRRWKVDVNEREVSSFATRPSRYETLI